MHGTDSFARRPWDHLVQRHVVDLRVVLGDELLALGGIRFGALRVDQLVKHLVDVRVTATVRRTGWQPI